MDSDRWDAKDFGDKENALLTRVLESSTKDVEIWAATSRIWLSPEGNGNPASQTIDSAAINGNGAPAIGKDRVRSAVVDEQKYILPECALAMLRVLERFLHLVTGIPSMSQDITSSLLDCLKLFNSRSSQLILGAGATRSAGLKRITTKHLALASQALSFFTAIIPYVREFIRRHSSSNSALSEFDKVRRLFQEHQSGIHEKLVDIMSSRVAIHVENMRKIDWEAEKDSTSVSPYMETLVAETGTLHRVLAKHLPETTVMMIMDPVFSSYREQLTMAFQSITLKSEAARQRSVPPNIYPWNISLRLTDLVLRLLSDVRFFKSKMEKIEGATDLVNHLTETVTAKALSPGPGADGASEATRDVIPASPSSTSPSPPLEGNGNQETA
jgi:vacuolar protein sorting-associated protein 54